MRRVPFEHVIIDLQKKPIEFKKVADGPGAPAALDDG